MLQSTTRGVAASISSRVEKRIHRTIAWATGRIRSSPRWYRLLNRRLFSDLTRQEMMLADTVRVNAYAAAMPNAVGPTDTVIDLGTGTGILAFLAARQTTGVVHAIEHADIIEVAQSLAADNGIGNVSFHRVHSSELRLDEPVDVLVHEQMGNFLLDERMVTNIADLRDRLLGPDGKIMPSRFEMYISPVQLKDEYVVPRIWAQDLHGIRFDSLRGRLPQSPGDRTFLLRPEAFGPRLCDDACCLTLDLHDVGPSDLPHQLRFAGAAVREGRLDGVAVWFRAHLDEHTSLTTSPHDALASNWFVPLLRLPDTSLPVAKGEAITVTLTASDLESVETWSWEVSVGADTSSTEDSARRSTIPHPVSLP